MDEFVNTHKNQLQSLNIPEILHGGLKTQLETAFQTDGDLEALAFSTSRIIKDPLLLQPTSFGAMVVMPHVCSWDILANPSRGMLDALGGLSNNVLSYILRSLRQSWGEADPTTPTERDWLLDGICDPRTWSRVILFRKDETVWAALPAPPYFPQVSILHVDNETEADLTGPFPFTYRRSPMDESKWIDLSLAYLAPGAVIKDNRLPSIDLVPSYTCPNTLTRAVRLAALLGLDAPECCLVLVKQVHANFVKDMHLVRQRKLERQETELADVSVSQDEASPVENDSILRVYTDANDPMKLGDQDVGLSREFYEMTETIEDADIVYSYQSLFAPGELKQAIEKRIEAGNAPFVNQFPYEGAFVQKDHLGREILRQHGLPRPWWSEETYDLDAQLTEFVGAAISAEERGEAPVWIVKPARGTRSKGHVITSSLAQILRLVDAGGQSRVVQRYIKNPVCYDGRKIDCRCLVMMTSAAPGRPSLFMYKTLFFRVANKVHNIANPTALMDNEAVLTATHLFDEDQRSSSNPLQTMPRDTEIITKLEADYNGVGFDWETRILPKIQEMTRELFSGTTEAFPDMGASKWSRALYGLDVMFQINDESVVPKLTEVTFCPSNNTVCNAFEVDATLRKSYCTDIFGCLFRGVVSPRIKKLQ